MILQYITRYNSTTDDFRESYRSKGSTSKKWQETKEDKAQEETTAVVVDALVVEVAEEEIDARSNPPIKIRTIPITITTAIITTKRATTNKKEVVVEAE